MKETLETCAICGRTQRRESKSCAYCLPDISEGWALRLCSDIRNNSEHPNCRGEIQMKGSEKL